MDFAESICHWSHLSLNSWLGSKTVNMLLSNWIECQRHHPNSVSVGRKIASTEGDWTLWQSFPDAKREKCMWQHGDFSLPQPFKNLMCSRIFPRSFREALSRENCEATTCPLVTKPREDESQVLEEVESMMGKELAKCCSFMSLNHYVRDITGASCYWTKVITFSIMSLYVGYNILQSFKCIVVISKKKGK